MTRLDRYDIGLGNYKGRACWLVRDNWDSGKVTVGYYGFMPKLRARIKAWRLNNSMEENPS